MTGATSTSLQRVLTTIQHREPDRVPLFLFPTMHGAKEVGLSLREYFSRAENVAEGQLRLQARYRHDCVSGFFYAAVETEAWGGEVLYSDDGPPNAAAPIIQRPDQIGRLEPPRVAESPSLGRVLRALELLKARVGGEVPVIGVVIAPFSLPVLQMGFGPYIELLVEQPALCQQLLRVNEEFCVQWANAQVAAGATAIAYFDPVSSPTVVPKGEFLRLGFEVARRAFARIHAPVAMHLASGRSLPIVGEVAQAGAAIVGTSAEEDLAELKAACRGRLTVLGNLNGIEMRRWTAAQAEAAVKAAIAKAGPGGGFILSDNHGEIPWQVPDEVLLAISEAVQRWGNYPLDWAHDDG
jgi:uroporphyrinogen decarboxylase